VIAVSKLMPTETRGLAIALWRTFETLLLKLLKRVMIIGCLPVVFSACTTVPDQTTEDLVGQRAISWAEALIDLDYDGALTYMTPIYQASPRADRFRGDFSGAGFWRSVTRHSVDCGESQAPSRCDVTIIIRMLVPPEVARETPIAYDMTWVLLDGQWYVYRK
tara:strand:+ start:417 stop:905 length:489 start_codon:yes stop_codon:yes gene_type:complete